MSKFEELLCNLTEVDIILGGPAHDALVEYVARLEAEVERLREVVERLRENVTAFASQLQAWGYGDASRELLDEVLCGKVNAPDYYALQDRLVACEASLVGMVQQYCGYRDDINPDATYHHDFMSAGENAFAYLLEHNLATLAENGVDIRFPEVE